MYKNIKSATCYEKGKKVKKKMSNVKGVGEPEEYFYKFPSLLLYYIYIVDYITEARGNYFITDGHGIEHKVLKLLATLTLVVGHFNEFNEMVHTKNIIKKKKTWWRFDTDTN